MLKYRLLLLLSYSPLGSNPLHGVQPVSYWLLFLFSLESLTIFSAILNQVLVGVMVFPVVISGLLNISILDYLTRTKLRKIIAFWELLKNKIKRNLKRKNIEKYLVPITFHKLVVLNFHMKWKNSFKMVVLFHRVTCSC